MSFSMRFAAIYTLSFRIYCPHVNDDKTYTNWLFFSAGQNVDDDDVCVVFFCLCSSSAIWFRSRPVCVQQGLGQCRQCFVRNPIWLLSSVLAGLSGHQFKSNHRTDGPAFCVVPCGVLTWWDILFPLDQFQIAESMAIILFAAKHQIKNIF